MKSYVQGLTTLLISLAAGKYVAAYAEAKGDAAIYFEAREGYSGIKEQWWIYPDGRIHDEKSLRGNIAADDVSELLKFIEGQGYFDVSRRYSASRYATNCKFFEISVSHIGRSKTVRFADCSKAPVLLFQIVDRIRKVLNSIP